MHFLKTKNYPDSFPTKRNQRIQDLGQSRPDQLKTKNCRRGAITLPVVLIVSAIVMELAITGILLSTSFTNAVLNERINSKSYAVAKAGAEDGVLKVIRYCPIGAVIGSSCPQSSYDIAINGETVTVLIKDELDGSNNPTGNKRVIASTAILNRVKRVQANLISDPVTGRIQVKSFKECYNYDSVLQICP